MNMQCLRAQTLAANHSQETTARRDANGAVKLGKLHGQDTQGVAQVCLPI